MLPLKLQHLIDCALIGLRNQTDTSLSPDFLWAISDFFGDMEETVAILSIPHKWRLMLALNTAYSMLHVWERQYPHDISMQQLFQKIDAIINNDFSVSIVENLFDEFDNWYQEFVENNPQAKATDAYTMTFIPYDLVKALLAIATGDRINDCSANQLTVSSILNCAFLEAGNPSIDPKKFSPQRWFSFWEHWLTTLVPRTWEMFEA